MRTPLPPARRTSRPRTGPGCAIGPRSAIGCPAGPPTCPAAPPGCIPPPAVVTPRAPPPDVVMWLPLVVGPCDAPPTVVAPVALCPAGEAEEGCAAGAAGCAAGAAFGAGAEVFFWAWKDGAKANRAAITPTRKNEWCIRASPQQAATACVRQKGAGQWKTLLNVRDLSIHEGHLHVLEGVDFLGA